MYICICNSITEEQVKQAASSSANAQEALKKLGVGSSCGICLIDALKNLGVSSHSSKKDESFGELTAVSKVQK